ncbi:DUF2848 domain-containing protein [Elioraea rosea]|uniref:DUF2848 domain-containing protein n=1 Tax=Elioraea rosea TaxID=2492390 RepID=UPI00194E6B6E|nr:DUF2848 domain-containing protein [Elioraea rosea]
MSMLEVACVTASGVERRRLAVRALVIAGLTGRDTAAVEHHLEELAAIGVKAPSRIPAYFRNTRSLITHATAIEVLGPDSSGEVEFVLVGMEDGLWVGLGSDHTDRRVEAVAIDVSKQLCPKVIAPRLWRFDDVAAHWDRLTLRAWIEDGEGLALYQDGTVAAIRPPEELIAGYTGGAPLPVGTVMFGGTFGAIGGIRPSPRFEMELADPVLGRSIRHGYTSSVLPLA